mmetsp:Transcript_73133/g.145046  ORF Transcript_73133/g.145046 Transcript_73133/m.145046 type:complete len:90 (+) Transcript_73133:69-338(+)
MPEEPLPTLTSAPPGQHPFLWFAVALAVMAAIAVMAFMVALQNAASGSVFQRKPQKSFPMQVLSGDDDGMDCEQDCVPNSGERELRRKR